MFVRLTLLISRENKKTHLSVIHSAKQIVSENESVNLDPRQIPIPFCLGAAVFEATEPFIIEVSGELVEISSIKNQKLVAFPYKYSKGRVSALTVDKDNNLLVVL